ncbi:hypothetical protein [Microbacterium amylolyticum]|uniref:Uncharacterized protein n=1 Tax=Microbacterium amylolyticum TaxID=936337 RepID=A0ABS4ZIT6_9MICO|nr:hypothetical protein [Microbacterium amylolyticum]MBP2437194.1 hypothetical protein [Microbacterium amylolyticum]
MADATQRSHSRVGVMGRIATSQGLVLPWGVTFVIGLLIALFGPASERWSWYAAAAGICVIVSFVVQLIIGRADGFILRTATASLGSIVLLGMISLVGTLFSAVGSAGSLFP